MKKVLFIFLLSLIACFSILLPLAGYTISGKVIGSNPTRLYLSGDVSMTVITDSAGNYQFSGLTGGGSYVITPARINYPKLCELISPLPESTVSGTVPITAFFRTDFCGFGYSPALFRYTMLDGDKVEQNFQAQATACCHIITSVKFYLDNIEIYSNTTPKMACFEVEYTYQWDARTCSDGQHLLKIEMINDEPLSRTLEIPVTVNNNSVLRGDANGDGIVNIVDALVIAQYSVGLQSPHFQVGAADVDCNGKVDILDALLLARYQAGLIARTAAGCIQ